MPISARPSRRPIDVVLAQLRERLAVIAAIDGEAMATVSRDPTTALRLALLASELRRKMSAEVGLCK